MSLLIEDWYEMQANNDCLTCPVHTISNEKKTKVKLALLPRVTLTTVVFHRLYPK